MASTSWRNCKNILFIRPDNMGDVIMMTPSLRAVKQTFGCKITLLTSQMGSLITPHIPYIDETLVYDLPWVKTNVSINAGACVQLIEKLRSFHFDGAVISTVYSQSPLPGAMLAFLSEIPLRLAYCRENPYGLLTDWVAEKEPYLYTRHQVTRELNLVSHIGAHTSDERLTLQFNKDLEPASLQKLASTGVEINKPWIVLHPGVSEAKREYPAELWAGTARQLYQRTGMQILITGAPNEMPLAGEIQRAAGKGTFSIAGLFDIDEFIALIANTRLAITVNTATAHIAAATDTSLIVLYALTNPQHTPWKVSSVVLPFSVPDNLRSKNEVIQYVYKKHYGEIIPYPSPAEIVSNALKLMHVYAEKNFC